MKCTHCGAELILGAKYCVHCGQSIVPAPNMSAEKDPSPNNSVQDSHPNNSVQDSHPNNSAQDSQKESKSSGVLQTIAVKILDIPDDVFEWNDNRKKTIVIVKGIIEGVIRIYFAIMILLFILSLAGCSTAIDSATIFPFLAVMIPAGAILALTEFLEKKYYKDHQKTTSIDFFSILRTIVLVIAFFAMINVMRPEAKAIRCVQKGHFEAYPNTTIEEAFNSKFQGGKWSAVKFANDYLVTYQGRSVLFGIVDVEFWVSLKDGTFYMDSVNVDEYELNLIEYAAFIAQLFEADNSSYQIDKLENDNAFIPSPPTCYVSI